MNCRIEWQRREGDETEHAHITRCVGAQGVYNVEFSNTELWSEGRLAIRWGDQGEQRIKGMYMYTDGSYKGEADVVGRTSVHDGIVTFTGSWHDPQDNTGEWDVYLEFEEPSEYSYTLSYDQPASVQ